LTQLPLEIADLPQLNKLRVQNNRIVHIDASLMRRLTNLGELKYVNVLSLMILKLIVGYSLAYNHLRSIGGLDKLTQLTKLRLSGNRLEKFPAIPSRLEALEIDNNPVNQVCILGFQVHLVDLF